jgi:hypothetical protein
MSSNINFASIEATYPVAGIDNDTQGFRDNFSAIKIALEVAKSEIDTLQSKSLLNSDMAANVPHINDLHGSTLSNGLYSTMYGTVHTQTVSSTAEIDLRNGPFQVFTLTTDTSLTFTNWAALSQYAVIRVHLLSNTITTTTVPWVASTSYSGNDVVIYKYVTYKCITSHTSRTTLELDQAKWLAFSQTPSLLTANAGTIRYENSFSQPINLLVNGQHKVIEAWSSDHGTHVYIRYLGEY